MLRHELIELAENGLLAVNMQGMMIGLDNYLEMMVGGERVLINKRVNMRVMQKLHANYDVYAKDGKSGEYSIVIPAYINGDRMVMFCLDGGVEFSTINEGVGEPLSKDKRGNNRERLADGRRSKIEKAKHRMEERLSNCHY